MGNMLIPCQGNGVLFPKKDMQQLARCSVSIAPLRVLPDHKSEQFSQLLKGDWVGCGRSEGAWTEVALCWNGDMGWVLSGQLQASDDAVSPLSGLSALQAEQLIGVFHTGDVEPSICPIDTTWQARYRKASSASLREALPCVVDEKAIPISLEQHVKECVQALTGAPYVWGGMSYLGVDCSGLVQLLYRYRGIPLPHAASKQIEAGRVLDFIQEVVAGDLAFFADEEGQVVHVGIMLSPTQIFHASARSGRAQVDAIDWQGIINSDGNRTHSLRVIKRLEE